MAASSDRLLLKFRPTDSVLGVTRKTLEAMATSLGVSETQVVHLALARLAEVTLAGYQADDGPLSARQWGVITADAAKHLPKGKLLAQASLFR